MAGEERSGPARGPHIDISPCRSDDRDGLQRLGHPPAIVDILCPSVARRIGWRLGGTLSRSAIAVDGGTQSILGSVQFLRSRRDRNTWMFGHWRGAAAPRPGGGGRRGARGGGAPPPARPGLSCLRG